jgi:hypothetical protein
MMRALAVTAAARPVTTGGRRPKAIFAEASRRACRSAEGRRLPGDRPTHCARRLRALGYRGRGDLLGSSAALSWLRRRRTAPGVMLRGARNFPFRALLPFSASLSGIYRSEGARFDHVSSCDRPGASHRLERGDAGSCKSAQAGRPPV